MAQRLKRRWIGIDITYLAIDLVRRRLPEGVSFFEDGGPVDLAGAQALAGHDKHQFELWALGMVNARTDKNKGADRGIDGRLLFHDEPTGGQTKQIVLSVKGGGTGVRDMRDLRGVIEREKADIGVLITLEEPTPAMRTEAAGAGLYSSQGWGKKYPRMQILTIAEILDGRGINCPPLRQVNVTFRRPPRKVTTETPEQIEIPELARPLAKAPARRPGRVLARRQRRAS